MFLNTSSTYTYAQSPKNVQTNQTPWECYTPVGGTLPQCATFIAANPQFSSTPSVQSQQQPQAPPVQYAPVQGQYPVPSTAQNNNMFPLLLGAVLFMLLVVSATRQ